MDIETITILVSTIATTLTAALLYIVVTRRLRKTMYQRQELKQTIAELENKLNESIEKSQELENDLNILRKKLKICKEIFIDIEHFNRTVIDVAEYMPQERFRSFVLDGLNHILNRVKEWREEKID